LLGAVLTVCTSWLHNMMVALPSGLWTTRIYQSFVQDPPLTDKLIGYSKQAWNKRLSVEHTHKSIPLLNNTNIEHKKYTVTLIHQYSQVQFLSVSLSLECLSNSLPCSESSQHSIAIFPRFISLGFWSVLLVWLVRTVMCNQHYTDSISSTSVTSTHRLYWVHISLQPQYSMSAVTG
jgi:hypothetical protein